MLFEHLWSLKPLDALNKTSGRFQTVCGRTFYIFLMSCRMIFSCVWPQICEFLTRSPAIFKTRCRDVFQSCSWPQHQIYLQRYLDISNLAYQTKTWHFLHPEWFLLETNQTISTAFLCASLKCIPVIRWNICCSLRNLLSICSSLLLLRPLTSSSGTWWVFPLAVSRLDHSVAG